MDSNRYFSFIKFIFLILFLSSPSIINAQAEIGISPDLQNICLGDSVDFFDNTASPTTTSWDWDFGADADTLTSTKEDPDWVVWTSPGDKVVRLDVNGGGGDLTDIVIITVNDTSEAPTGITATPVSPICEGTSTTLSVNGGSLGYGASWQWYKGSCGVTSVGSGSSIIVSPSDTTKYYVRAEGTCDTTTCDSITIDVKEASQAATGISAGATEVCPGDDVELTVQGGYLGTNADWYWYGGSCEGTPITTGDTTVNINVTQDTTIYVRAGGDCDTTSCASITIALRDTSQAATGIEATDTTICGGNNTELSINGGTLGYGASWQWYTGSCGTTSVGSGNTLGVSPTDTTKYFVRAEGVCDTTGCDSLIINVKESSQAATGISASSTEVCPGDDVELTVQGGYLGTNADWYWYGGSCEGTPITTGDTTVNINVTQDTTIYVRAGGDCDTTSCASITIALRDTSQAATGIEATDTTICGGNSTELSINGGTLGYGASWQWYTGSCGTTSVGSGNTLEVSPTDTTKYFVRAEGVCDTTGCDSLIINVKESSQAATGISASSTEVCPGDDVELTVQGGYLGTNADWYWYGGSCEGTPIITGDTTVNINVTQDTTIYVRAGGDCDTTSCASITIALRDTSQAATGIEATDTTICGGNNTELSINGGTLGYGASWQWYTGSCGTTSVGSGNTLEVSPTDTTKYFVRAEGVCDTTGCDSLIINVKESSQAATGISASSTEVCPGDHVELTVQGGYLGTNADWYWYGGSCEGTPITTGDTTVNINVTQDTTIYVRAGGDCDTTSCASITIALRDTSQAATGIEATDTTICGGNSTELSINGGTLGYGASWQWYTGSCGTTSVGSGNTLEVSPTDTTKYFVRAEGVCDTTGCDSLIINVKESSQAATGISASSTEVCPGDDVELTVQGGYLGTNADWYWYGGSCEGTPITTGDTTVNINVTQDTTIYVRAGGDCDTTSCASITIALRDTSQAATGIEATDTTICGGNNTELSINGGTLGYGASWQWYTGSCGTTSVGSGNTLEVSPTDTTKYFVRAEGVCDTTGCDSLIINVKESSQAATGISASSTEVCPGDDVELTVQGGYLGTNADWYWYGGSCEGTPIITGDTTVNINVTQDTTIYVRAGGDCDTTSCASITIALRDTSQAATGIEATDTTICGGNSTELSINGGTLGYGASWQWYKGSCGTTSVGSGNTLEVSPTDTTKYFVRAEGVCDTTGCDSLIINVKESSQAATGISASSTEVCPGDDVELTVQGGYLGTNADWYWYGGSCEGTPITTGDTTVNINVTQDTTIYVRAGGDCDTTSCASITIALRDTSQAATGIEATDTTICGGNSTELSINGGTLGYGASWQWYTGSCGTTSVGSGNTLEVSPTDTTKYFVRAEGVCDTTGCDSLIINVKESSQAATGISASSTEVCPGDDVELTVQGGYLGTNADWYWYGGSCEGTPITTGDTTVNINVTQDTTIYVRAGGDCDTTSCASITIALRDTSQAATGIEATDTTICGGNSTELSINGGTLGYGASWQWYTGSCGTTSVGSGNTLGVSPTDTTKYFVRAEGVCDTTGCDSLIINVKESSQAATGISASSTEVCPGDDVELTVQGGYLGTNADWYWYGGSCEGTPITTGDTTVNINVTQDTTIYVRAGGDCDTTSCASITIALRDTSQAATGIEATDTTICGGNSTELSINGGTLGYGASWQWYTGSCGTTSVGSGNTLEVSPTDTTKYFVRAEGVCDTTGCDSLIINVKESSQAATGISASSTEVCPGDDVELTVQGGYLGTNADWYWYGGSCEGTPIITGDTTVNINVTQDTTIYVRAGGDCDTTSCASITIALRDTSQAATGIEATDTTICGGNSTELSINGGTLGYGASWQWYKGSCGTTSVGSGNTLEVSPTDTTKYFVRAEGVCDTTGCDSLIINVKESSQAATGISASSTEVCPGDDVELTVQGGYLGTNADWYWYGGSCEGTPITTGDTTVNINVTQDTTIYVRAGGDCDTTSCASITIALRDTSQAATGIEATDTTICGGNSTELSINGGTLGYGASWQWYTGSCGTTSVGSGNTLEVSPTDTTKYFVRAEGVCDTTGCDSLIINVKESSQAATGISASSTEVCPGDDVELTVQGGYLGTNADWYWYGGSCEGTPITTGDTTVNINVTQDTTIYVRAGGDCDTTSCASITIALRDTSQAATGIEATDTTICGGNSTELSINGGTLGYGASWQWYTGSCGTTSVGSGNTLGVSPTDTTKYFVRAEGVCDTTGCDSLIINVKESSQAATGISASSTEVCPGDDVELTVQGGYLGTNADWYWYGGSCEGTPITTGDTTVNINVTQDTTIYVRAGGDCDTTSCASITIALRDTSQAATGIEATDTTICGGNSTELSINGGTLGYGASWQWYTGSCGTTSVGSGNTLEVSPTDTTKYFVRAEGVCDTTGCDSLIINVKESSQAATGISASSTEVCPGDDVELTVQGGYLGTNADWYWYGGSCEGTPITTGDTTVNINVTQDTTIYVRAGGDCDTTSCASITIALRDTSQAATGIEATDTTICGGNSTELSINGGTLGYGASWQWYTGSCGTTSVGSGNTLEVSPTDTTKYFVRAEGVCDTTGCDSLIINVKESSQAATGISASSTEVCPGDDVELTVQGGYLGTNADWYWYGGSCEGTPITTGDTTVNINVTQDTTIYVRAGGDCDTTSCASITIALRDTSQAATGIEATDTTICGGNSTELSINGGTLGYGASWQWYTGSCGTTSVGSGNTLEVSPTDTTKYFVRAEGVCDTTGCDSLIINVKESSQAATGISASSTEVCPGDDVELTVQGGYLGTNADWYWYGGSCEGTPITTGDTTVNINVTQDTTIYVRAGGDCDTTSCASITIALRDTSQAATGIEATDTTICGGNSTELSINGGTLGYGASWQWYTGSCGTTSVGSGNTLEVSPTDTTKYFVRAEGVCDTTGCDSLIINVKESSQAATGISASSTEVCPGDDVELTVQGGYLGTNADWYWYGGSCEGTPITTGDTTVNINVTQDTTIYVRAGGDCDTTSCASITIALRDTSQAATGIEATDTTICGGNNTELSINGGTLGYGASWQWYTGSCGTTSVGSGNTLEVSPTDTTKYFVRAEGVCDTTGCDSLIINVKESSQAATGISASSTEVCPGDDVELTVQGGYLGTNADWYWYGGSCEGTPITTGDTTVNINVTQDTTIYVRAGGDCDTTSCASITIALRDTSQAATGIEATDTTICGGNSTELSINGGTLGYGASWQWYTGSCGTTSVGSGNTLEVSPTDTTKYFVRAEGVCDTTGCDSLIINVKESSQAATGISASSTEVCPGDDVELTVQGGYLGTNADWYWYGGSCEGTPIITGDTTVNINVTQDTTIYVRAGGDCGATTCASITINVRDTSQAPIGINYSTPSTTICEGTNTTLSVNGGSLGDGATWNWYTGSCGGTYYDNGSIITVAPDDTTEYFVRAEGTCNTTICESIVINVNKLPSNNGPINGKNVVCQADTNINYFIPEFDFASNYVWEVPSDFSIDQNFGDSIKVSLDSNAISGTVLVYGENSCGIGDTLQLLVNVDTLPSVYFEMPLSKYTNDSEEDTIEIYSPPGGVFSGPGIVNINRTFHPSIAGLGDHRIEYTYTTPAGCSNMHFDSVEVFVPGGYIDGLENQYCNYEEQDTIEAITDEPVVGIFTGDGITDIGNNKAIFDPNTVVEGDHTISFTYFDTATSNYITIDDYTYIDSIGNVYFIGNQTNYCLGESTDELIGFPDEGGNGVFSGKGIFLSHFFNPDTAGVGVHHPVTYTFTSSYGCVKDSTKQINVHPLPVVSFDMDSAYCANHEPVFISGNPVGGNFTGPNLVVYGDSVQFSPGNNIIGENQFTYSYTDTNGCSSNYQETVTILSVPILGISNQLKNEFCVNGNKVVIKGLLSGSNNPYGSFIGNGIIDTNNNDGQAVFDPMDAGVGGPYTITFMYTDTNGCTNTYNGQTQVLSLPNINISSDLKAEYCVNDASSTIYGLYNGENAIDGFFSGNGISDPNLNDGQAVFTPSSAGVGGLYPITFTFTDTNGCTNTDTNYTSVLSLPTISISENFQSQYCINYQPDTIYGFYNGDTASSGDFAGNGVINASPNDGKAIFFPSAAGIGGPYSISFEFTDSNGCTNVVDSTTQVFGLPIIGISDELEDKYCINSPQSSIYGEYYGATANSGYFIGNGVLDTNQNDGQAVFNPIAAGVSPSHEITFIYTDTNDCTNSIVSETAVLELPNINISNLDNEYCLNDGSSNLTGLYFSSPAGKGTFSGTGIVDTDPTDGLAKFYPDSAGVGGPYNILFTFTDTNGCTNLFDSTTFVLALPNVSISGNLLSEYCLNNPSHLIQGFYNSMPANSGYFSGIGIIDTNINDGLAVFDPYEAGAGGPYSISYTFTDTNSCSNISENQVMVQELPNIAISDDLQDQYCINVASDTIFGLYNNANSNQGLFSGTGIIDNDTTDGMAIFDPGLAGIGGPYSILYTFTDTNNCIDTTYNNIEVNNIDNVSITNIDDIYCSDIDQVQVLQGSPSAIDPEDALWTFGTESSNGSTFSFTPLEYNAGPIEVSYQYTNDDNCIDTTWDTIFIAPIPVARFEVTDNCMEDTLDFFDLSIPEDTLLNPQDSITSWEWYFTSVGVPDTTIQHPSHLYTSEGNKNILLIVTNTYGCDDVLDTNIVFTGSPTADFDWNNECFGVDSTYFFSLVDTTIYSIEEYIWNFGDNTSVSLENPAHQYDSVSDYNVSLVVETVNGCSDTVEQIIYIRPFVSSYPYMQNFEAGTGGWEDESDSITSWAYGEPNGININHAASGSNAWITNLNGNYFNNESSFVEGPCFNFSNLQKPMIKFKLWHLTDLDLDGAVLQAYRNEDEGWFRVGSLDEGVNWYNSFSIVGNPGNQSQGWSGNSGTGWIDARHDLDMLAGEPYVRFRIAFGSDANSTQEGVSFDDIWVGERNRFVLIEHFTNNSDVESAAIIPELNDYMDENSLYAIDIRHHVYYPGDDAFYNKYPSGPSARNFYYSFFDVPFTILDGKVFKGNTNELLNNSKNILNTRSLKEALFQVRMSQTINNEDINVNIELESYKDIPQKEIALFLALIEKQATDETSSFTGTYRNVLRNMLPDPGGTYFNKEWNAGEIETINLSGSLKNFDDINQLRIVAFIQDISTKEIYQSSKLDLEEVISFSKDSTKNNDAGKLNFQFYPLPANENVNIAMNKTIENNLNVEVYNSFGQMKYKNIIPANSLIYELNTEELVNGIYYIRIYDSNKLLKSKKILVFH